MPGRRTGTVPALKDINGVCPGFLWWIWAATPCHQRLHGVKAEKHSEVDKAWELKLSKKYNDLAGGRAQTTLKFQDVKRPAVWEAAYPDQNTPHAFTGLLQRFQYPMGDCNHEILCTMFLCERRACKYHMSSPGRPMIHKLDIHSGGNNVVTEDLSGLNLNNRFMQLLPDSSPVLLGCNCLRTDSLKAFRINPMGNQASRKLLQSRARSFARLVAGAQVPEACSTLSRTDLEDPLNVSDDGKTFTCAITGDEAPIQEGHKVTIKQLLQWHACQFEPVHKDSDAVPIVIERAVPGLDATQFQFLRDRVHFLLSWAYVREKPAVQLLRHSLEAFDGPQEREKVIERFALMRQVKELQRLGMPIPRGARHILHSGDGVTARPSTCSSSDARTRLYMDTPVQPLHTGAWMCEEIDTSRLILGPCRALQALRRPVVPQFPGASVAQTKAGLPVPGLFGQASATAALEGLALGGLTWRATSLLVSGTPRPAPGRSPTAAGVNPKLPMQFRNGKQHAGDMTAHQNWEQNQYESCHADDTMHEEPDVPRPNTSAISAARVGVDMLPVPDCSSDTVQASVLEDEQILGQLGEESKHLAEMSKSLLKRAAHLLGKTRAFEVAMDQVASLGSDGQGIDASNSAEDTHAEPDAQQDEHELTNDEMGLMQDLVAAA